MRNRIVQLSIATVIIFASGTLCAETVIPLKGQSADQIQADVTACKSKASGSQSTTSGSTPQGGRLHGAAAGAVVGSAAAQTRGNQYEVYDRADDDVKQEYRQENARAAARAGAALGGIKERQARREAAQKPASSSPASTEAYTVCLTGLGYSITQ